ncbi:RidA family protein [Hungatella effluvii]|uniref:RidA family protein n=1 Tax=Hungatella effluvii TaxID=1096246 RepID=UPI0022E48582|nr:RidA family protein [Hungatella effluvii]
MKTIYTKTAPEAIGPYSQTILAGNLIFTSGQIPIDPVKGGLAEGGIKVQARQAIANVSEILKEAGTDLTKVIKTTCFLADMNDFALFNEVYAEYFTGKPARSCVAVKQLPKNALCEIEVIAEVMECVK